MNRNILSLVSMGAALIAAPALRSVFTDPLGLIGLERKGSRGLSGVAFAVGGMAVGAGIALLLAPQSGADTRRNLSARAHDLGNDAKALVTRTGEAVEGHFSNALSNLKHISDESASSSVSRPS